MKFPRTKNVVFKCPVIPNQHSKPEDNQFSVTKEENQQIFLFTKFKGFFVMKRLIGFF